MANDKPLEAFEEVWASSAIPQLTALSPDTVRATKVLCYEFFEYGRLFSEDTCGKLDVPPVEARVVPRSDLEAELEAARKLVNIWRAAATEQPDIGALVDRFLAWPLPASVHSDAVVSMPGKPHRSGTNLLTADEARQMFEYVLDAAPEENKHD